MPKDENWISEQKKNADMLKMILSTSKKLLNMPIDAIDYQLVVDEIKELSGAWVVGINTYEQSGTISITRAISNFPSIIKDISKILGFSIVGKEWVVKPERVKNLQGGKLQHFNNLYEASKGELSKAKAKMLEALFNLGDVFVIELSYEKQGSQGDIIFLMKQGDIFKNEDVVEIYAGLIGSFLMRTRNEERMGIFSKIIDQTTDNVFITDREGVIEYVNPAFESLYGYSALEAVGKTPRILKSGLYTNEDYELLWNTILAGNVSTGDITNRKKTGELIYENKIITPIRNVKGEITHFVYTSRNITEKMQHEHELESINKVSMALRVAKTVDEMLLIMLDKILEITKATQGSIWLYDAKSKELQIVANRGLSETDENIAPPEKLGSEISKLVFSTGKLFVSRDINQDVRLSDKIRNEFVPGTAVAIVPIFAGDSILGTFDVNVKLPREISPSDLKILTALSEIAANAIQRMRLHEKSQMVSKYFASLHSVDLLINSSNNLYDLLNTILDYLIELLTVDAAAILLYDSDTSTLVYFAGKGFRGKNIEKTKLNISEGYAGTAALNQQTVIVNDLRTKGSEYARYDLLKDEEFISYIGIPLINNNEIIGVVDIFHRSILNPNPEWVNFSEALASQAAIAIGKSTLFNNLQRTNTELVQAYDKTIEGWSKAMDLRDQETEGHTQRVTELAVRLAQASGLSEKEIVHIRRGALLHDMGKVGIPDGILLKPGPLTDEEWVIMRKHPQYAFDMLSPIEFLNAALDIPYCHHEKWDGSGYPRGLKGEEIPIAARIFAIVDVYDALRSDRPYRKAWSKEKVKAHIKSLSGTHFEPKIVELFLNLPGI
ncbi:MAG: putative PAS/PAC sensor protein [Erysipelotrichaceae bacterium]|nr:MAG: putative PAS/PAC sensor [Erysipelotrichaceae bacterium]TXT17193.1 MAG: putative PAS/PAC sensor protein [Erysipelotrichaceae bacterium]